MGNGEVIAPDYIGVWISDDVKTLSDRSVFLMFINEITRRKEYTRVEGKSIDGLGVADFEGFEVGKEIKFLRRYLHEPLNNLIGREVKYFGTEHHDSLHNLAFFEGCWESGEAKGYFVLAEDSYSLHGRNSLSKRLIEAETKILLQAVRYLRENGINLI